MRFFYARVKNRLIGRFIIRLITNNKSFDARIVVLRFEGKNFGFNKKTVFYKKNRNFEV